jgi:diguanylate cyclase (GGDEF)-like protein
MDEPKLHEGPPGFWDRPEQSLLDAGKDGELLIAKIRVALTFVLLLVPLADIITAANEGREQHFIGFIVTASACVLSIAIYFLVISDRRRRWLPLATSLFDVSFITLTLVLYGLLVGPVVLTNNRLSFDTYFLALGGTCLRYDKRIALIAGLVAIAQWIASVLFVLAHFGAAALAVDEFYGRFAWSDQISRVVLLATATALNVFIVAGIQKQRILSTADALTGAYNRRFLDDFLRNELARAARHKNSLAVAMIDVDHFKRFNDTHGHGAGDRALKKVAQTLELAVRRTDLVARYGGEEFVVVLPDSPIDQAVARMNAIREAIEREPLMLAWKDGRSAPAKLTVSIGVASWSDVRSHTASELIAEADSNLYRAKNNGRNRVVGPTD